MDLRFQLPVQLHKAREWLRSLRRFVPAAYYCLSCLCLFTVALALFSAFFRPCMVQGSSMTPTLQDGDRLLLTCMNYEPTAGDIVAVRRDNATPLIKRVIAVGGDTLYIDPATGEVYRNGALLDEPYLEESTPAAQLRGAVTVPDGSLFVMGDNRDDSHDSRYTDIGFVAEDAVIGKAVWRFYPPADMGGL